MLALRLVRLIEAHSDELADGLVARINASQRAMEYGKIPEGQAKQQAQEIYSHLGDWLINKTESDIELRYTQIGRMRAEQEIPFSAFIWAMVLSKENLWHFLQRQAPGDRAIELFGELELIQLLVQFFDRALYYATVGYEGAIAQKRAA